MSQRTATAPYALLSTGPCQCGAINRAAGLTTVFDSTALGSIATRLDLIHRSKELSDCEEYCRFVNGLLKTFLRSTVKEWLGLESPDMDMYALLLFQRSSKRADWPVANPSAKSFPCDPQQSTP